MRHGQSPAARRIGLTAGVWRLCGGGWDLRRTLAGAGTRFDVARRCARRHRQVGLSPPVTHRHGQWEHREGLPLGAGCSTRNVAFARGRFSDDAGLGVVFRGCLMEPNGVPASLRGVKRVARSLGEPNPEPDAGGSLRRLLSPRAPCVVAFGVAADQLPDCCRGRSARRDDQRVPCGLDRIQFPSAYLRRAVVNTAKSRARKERQRNVVRDLRNCQRRPVAVTRSCSSWSHGFHIASAW